MDGKFIFGGVDSADYNVWIKAGGTYGAASRRFTTEIVPGRDGSLTIDDGAFEEKEHSYECHIGDDFPANIQAFRNAIMAQNGRARLTDSYHPDEFYRARYMRGLEPDVAALAKAGEFTMAFSRDPRRFLVSGEAAQNIPAATSEELSGNVVSFDGKDGLAAITGAVVSVVPQQSGSGDPSPTNIREVTGWASAKIYERGVNYFDNSGWTLSGSATFLSKMCPVAFKDGSMTFYNLDDTWNGYAFAFDAKGVVVGRTAGAKRTHLTIRRTSFTSGDGTHDYDSIASVQFRYYGVTDHDYDFERNTTMLLDGEYDSSIVDYVPYIGVTYPVTWTDVGTVYGGTLDVTNGTLTKEYDIVDLGSLSWYKSSLEFRTTRILENAKIPPSQSDAAEAICSSYKVLPITKSGTGLRQGNVGVGINTDGHIWAYVDGFADLSVSDFSSLMNGVMLCFKLAESVTYQLTATQIATLTGTNNVWADTGDITLTIANPSTLENPTYFASKPKMRIYGHGIVNIGSRSVTVSGNFPYVDIDCELGDATYNGANANSVVSFSGGFPVLNPGTNYISYSGVTAVEITPRWWRL